MTRDRLVRIIEVLVGPLLATLCLIPFLLFGGLGIGFAILATLVDPASHFASLGPHLTLLFWIASGAVGVVSLWFALFRDEGPMDVRSSLLLAAGLLLGAAAASRWLWVMSRHEPGYTLRTWATWLVLLGGPLVVGARQLWALVLEHLDATDDETPP